MASPIRPRRIPFTYRLQVWALRALMFVFKLSVPLRPKPPAPGPVTHHKYGSHPEETLEFTPRKPGSPERDPVVYIHGGGWVAGKKELYRGDLYFLADQGHPVFNVEYPMAPENPHPGILRSLLRALQWIRDNHPGSTSAHFMGDSAGGNLVAMLGVLSHNPELVRDVDEEAEVGTAVACSSIVSIYGVLDRLSWIKNEFPGAKAMLQSYGGEAAFLDEVSPKLAITPMDLEFSTLPPCYLSVGTADPLCESTKIFSKRIADSSNEVVTDIFEDQPHGFFNFSSRPACQEMRANILAFIARHDSKSS